MTQRQLVARFFAALASFDSDAAAALVSDDYEGMAVGELPLHGRREVYSGKGGIRSWIAEVAEEWERLEVQVARILLRGELLVAIGVYEVYGRAEGGFGALEQRLPFVAVIRVKDEEIQTIHTYARYEDAVRAEGLASEPRWSDEPAREPSGLVVAVDHPDGEGESP